MNVVVKSRHRSGLGMMSPVEWIISVPGYYRRQIEWDTL